MMITLTIRNDSRPTRLMHSPPLGGPQTLSVHVVCLSVCPTAHDAVDKRKKQPCNIMVVVIVIVIVYSVTDRRR